MQLPYFIDYKVSGIKYSGNKGSSYDNGRLGIKEQYPRLHVMYLNNKKMGIYASQCGLI